MNNEVTEDIRQFILGGTSDFTIQQESTNGKPSVIIKYRVKKNDTGTCWFIYTEISKDSDLVSDGKHLVYQGYLNRNMQFNIGKKGIQDYNKQAINGLLWVLRHNSLPPVVHVYHHGKCSVCGRKLTDIESLKYGVGPICRKKINPRL